MSNKYLFSNGSSTNAGGTQDLTSYFGLFDDLTLALLVNAHDQSTDRITSVLAEGTGEIGRLIQIRFPTEVARTVKPFTQALLHTLQTLEREFPPERKSQHLDSLKTLSREEVLVGLAELEKVEGSVGEGLRKNVATVLECFRLLDQALARKRGESIVNTESAESKADKFFKRIEAEQAGHVNNAETKEISMDLIQEAKDGGWQALAEESAKRTRDVVLVQMKKLKAGPVFVAGTKKFLHSEFGFAVWSLALGLGLPYVPKARDNKHVQRVAQELRKGGFRHGFLGVGDVIVDTISSVVSIVGVTESLTHELGVGTASSVASEVKQHVTVG